MWHKKMYVLSVNHCMGWVVILKPEKKCLEELNENLQKNSNISRQTNISQLTDL